MLKATADIMLLNVSFTSQPTAEALKLEDTPPSASEPIAIKKSELVNPDAQLLLQDMRYKNCSKDAAQRVTTEEERGG